MENNTQQPQSEELELAPDVLGEAIYTYDNEVMTANRLRDAGLKLKAELKLREVIRTLLEAERGRMWKSVIREWDKRCNGISDLPNYHEGSYTVDDCLEGVEQLLAKVLIDVFNK